MKKTHQSVEQAYALAKQGRWDQVLSLWQSSPVFTGGCSRYQNPFSGWTFLHQAARFGHQTVCRELVRLGSPIGTLNYDDESAADVAKVHGHLLLAKSLRQACLDNDSSWAPPRRPDLLPSSRFWEEAQERRASGPMRVAYCGGVVEIPGGARYFADSFERPLIGFHGTYDPPSDMGCGSMI